MFERFTDEKIGCSCGKRLTWKQAGKDFSLVNLTPVFLWKEEDMFRGITYSISYRDYRKLFGITK
jgi:hypothetical protein